MFERGKNLVRPENVFGLLDAGARKIACLVAARTAPKAPPAILGFAYRRSRGVDSGGAADIDEAEQAIRATVGAAERQAGFRLDGVLLTGACGPLASRRFTANAGIESEIVAQADIRRAEDAARAFARRGDRAVLHLGRTALRLDGAPVAGDPRGRPALRLSADFHALTAGGQAAGSLPAAARRCYLDAGGLIAAPLASALGCTTEDERRQGVICIDLGAATTGTAVFRDGQFVFASALPQGGHQITLDIARALETSLAAAGRIKALYGALIETQADEYELISYPPADGGSGAMRQTTKASVSRIVRERVSSILGAVAGELAGERSSAPGTPVVLTGGGARILGIGAFGECFFGGSVRVGKPRAAVPLPDTAASPEFSALAGLLALACSGAVRSQPSGAGRGAPSGYLDRVREWLHSGF